MKLLTQDKMITLVCSTAAHVRTAAERLLPVMPFGTSQSKLENAWKEGILLCNTICLDGNPAAVIFWHRGLDRTLVINGCAALFDLEKHTEAFVDGMELLARQHDLNSIIFHSARAGMARAVAPFGYKPESVMFRKYLS